MDRATLVAWVLLVLAGCGRNEATDASLSRDAIAACAEESSRLNDALASLLPTECPVHHFRLEQVVVPMVYGLIDLDQSGYADAHRRLFPFHGAIGFGGCIPGDSHWATTLCCAACREAEVDWERGVAAQCRPFPLDAAMRADLVARYEAIEARPAAPGAAPR